jgi:hypothetical protein
MRRSLLLLSVGGVLGLAQAAAAQSQVTANWLNPVNGSWGNPPFWSSNPFFPSNNNGNPNHDTYHVVMPSGAYTLSLDISNVIVDSIDMNGGTLLIDQHALSIVPGGIIDVAPSAQLHLFFGTLNNATINLGTGGTGLRLERDGNTLSGVTINGDATFTDNTAAATITSGLSVNGTLTFQNRLGGLTFAGTETVTGGNYFFDTALNPTTRFMSAGAGANVTFDPNVFVHGRDLEVHGPTGLGMLANQGRISADIAGQSVSITGRFTNSGVIEAIGGGTLNLLADSLSSAGTVRAGPGSTLNIGGQASFAGASFDTAAGTVNLRGTLNNAGNTLALGASTGSWNIDGGTISGGAVTTAPGTTLNAGAPSNNRLQGVNFDGQLNVASSGRMFVTDGSLHGGVSLGAGACSTSRAAGARPPRSRPTTRRSTSAAPRSSCPASPSSGPAAR